MKKNLALIITGIVFSFIGFAQQFTKVTGNVVTRAEEGHGGTWADYDKDGDLDLYVNVRFPSVDNPQAYNYLFQNNCNGNFTRITAIPGGVVSEPGITPSYTPATWVDYDNDGNEDLFYLRSDTTNLLYRNNGDGTFTQITNLSFVMDNGPSRHHGFVDFDNDGDLDFYLVSYSRFCIIYRNDGNETYTPLQTLFPDSTGTMTGMWGDYDNDGYMDLFTTVASWPPPDNPTGTLRLFHNNGNNTFSQIINGVPASFGSYQYDPSWIDYDNDRDLDIYIRGSFLSPNVLYRNEGNGIFTTVPDAGGLNSLVHNNGGVAWGDYDNDGDLDVYMSAPNGWGPFPFVGNLLYKNNGNGTFTADSTEIVTNDTMLESYAGTFVDYDNDGDLDLYVFNAFGAAENFFYRNNGNSNHWVDVKCKGTISNKNAIGARIYVKTTIGGQPQWQMREINTNLSFAFGGLSPLNQHFGLGDATVIDSLKIVWPVSGTTQVFTNVSSDRFIEITEGVNVIAEAKPCRPDLLPENPAVITGKVFSDTDNDCLFNSSNDFPVANRIMQTNPGPDFVFSSNSGDYEFRLNGGTYNVTQATISNDLWNLQECQPNSAYTVSVNNGDTAAGKNFSLNAISTPTCNATVDINSIPMVFADNCPSGTLLTTPCPGFQWKYCVIVTNALGNMPIGPNSTLQIVLDPNMTFVEPDPNLPPNTSTCTFSGTFPVIQNTIAIPPGGTCTVCFDVNVGAPSQSSYLSTANFTAICGAQTDFSTDQAPDGSACACDPNDKLSAPKGCGPLGNISKTQPLTYIVRFQNTGTGPAHDIVIRDVLDDNLDITTLQILASSHAITHIQIIPDNALIISFEGIELPDSGSNPLGSNGFVAFSIKPKSNLPDGTQITNQAGIYFDFNEVVLTNTTLNTLLDIPEPIADFTDKHSCTNIGFVYDFTYTGGTTDSATFFWDFGMGASPQTSTQQNPTGIIFNSTGTRQVTLTVTRFGCTASIIKTVEVMDVNCGKDKVLICHKPPGNPNNPQTICISKNALLAHLSHGDCLGECSSMNAKINSEERFDTVNEIKLSVSPNPFNSSLKVVVKSQKQEVVLLELFNTIGQKITSLSEKINSNEEYAFVVSVNNLPSGIYILKIHTAAGERFIKLVRAP